MLIARILSWTGSGSFMEAATCVTIHCYRYHCCHSVKCHILYIIVLVVWSLCGWNKGMNKGAKSLPWIILLFYFISSHCQFKINANCLAATSRRKNERQLLYLHPCVKHSPLVSIQEGCLYRGKLKRSNEPTFNVAFSQAFQIQCKE